MNNSMNALTEQELDHLVELDAASQGDIAGGVTPTILATIGAATATIEATSKDFMPTSACSTRGTNNA